MHYYITRGAELFQSFAHAFAQGDHFDWKRDKKENILCSHSFMWKCVCVHVTKTYCCMKIFVLVLTGIVSLRLSDLWLPGTTYIFIEKFIRIFAFLSVIDVAPKMAVHKKRLKIVDGTIKWVLIMMRKWHIHVIGTEEKLSWVVLDYLRYWSWN